MGHKSAAVPPVFPLADCHPSILQRIIGLCDKEDLFLLRLVNRQFRDAVGQQVEWLRPDELPDDLAAKFPNLVVLDLDHLRPREISESLGPLLPQLLHLRSLRGISLRRGCLTDQWLPALGLLTELHIRYSETAEAIPDVAAHCSSLQCLAMSGMSGKKLHWAVIHRAVAQRADTLVRVELPCVSGDLWGAQALPPLNTGMLTFLSLHSSFSPPDTIDACIQLGAFTSLDVLHITSGRISDDGIMQLCALTQLTSLMLGGGGYSCAGVAQLSRLRRLAHLRLSQINNSNGLQGGADVLSLGEALSGLPSLQQLSLSGCNGEKLGTFSRRALSRLTKLHLKHAGLSDTPSYFLRLTELRRLMLCGSLLQEDGQLYYLAGLGKLTRLEICSSGLAFSNTGGYWLANLTALRQLCMARNHSITKEALEQLRALSALSALELSFQDQQQLPSLAPLEHLPLGWLRLPAHYQSAAELPERLRVPFLKGRRSHIFSYIMV